MMQKEKAFNEFKIELRMALGREGKGLFCVYADGKHIIAYEPTQKETFCSISVYKLEPAFWAGELPNVTEIAADMAESLRERIKRDFGEDFFRERCNALGLDFD